MNVLNNIKTESIVSIDVETVRLSKTYEELSEDFQSAWEYKNKFEGEVPTYEELSEKWEKSASLYAEFSKVCAVSISFLYSGKLNCKEFYGENEYDLLTSLADVLENIYNSPNDYRLAGHSSKFFDYPFLCKRFVINGIKIPKILDVLNLKPWEQKNLCTNELWKMGGTGHGSSLQALCTVLGIPVSKVDLVGDEVGTTYFNGEFQKIGRYCSFDSVATFNVIRVFKGESIFKFEDVNYVEAYTPQEEIMIFQRLMKFGILSEELKNEFREILSESDDTDLEKASVLIKAHYLKPKGGKKENKKREEEVDTLIQEISNANYERRKESTVV